MPALLGVLLAPSAAGVRAWISSQVVLLQLLLLLTLLDAAGDAADAGYCLPRLVRHPAPLQHAPLAVSQ
jgi:hypothetical protein